MIELVGTTLAGRWELLELIGAGGMSVVFKARNLQMDNIVCVKILRPQIFGDTGGLRRLQVEAKALAALSHPNVLRIIAMESDEHRCFLVTEFVEGRPLDAVLKEGPLRDERAKNLFRQVSGALQYAHEKGIVHRDLKPSNVMITSRDGIETAKILDFGIAKMIDAQTMQKLTKSGTVLGTPQYMAPEQCSAGAADARTDIYALGCMLHECLTGKPAFDGDSAVEIMMKHVDAEASQIRSALGAVAQRAMAKDPADRFQSAAEFAEAMDSNKLPAAPRAVPRHKMKYGSAFGLKPMLAAISLILIATLLVWMWTEQQTATKSEVLEMPEYNHNATDREKRKPRAIWEALTPSRNAGYPADEKGFSDLVDVLLADQKDVEVFSDACEMKGIVANRHHNWVDAQRWFELSLHAAHQGGRTNAWAAIELAVLLDAHKHPEEADQILDTEYKLLQGKKDKGQIQKILGTQAFLAQRRGHHDLAQRYFEQAADSEPPDTWIQALWLTRRVENDCLSGNFEHAHSLLKRYGTRFKDAVQPTQDEYRLATAILESVEKKDQKALSGINDVLSAHRDRYGDPWKSINVDQCFRCQLRMGEQRMKNGDFSKDTVELLKSGQSAALATNDKFDIDRADKDLLLVSDQLRAGKQ
jgi:serine/threonine protein kinase